MKTCLRCDWEGVTDDAACPSCGTPLFRTAPAAPPGPAPPRPALEPERPLSPTTTEDPPRRATAAVLAVIAVFVVVAGSVLTPKGEPTVAAPPARSSGEAARAASLFLAAYGDLDAERAIGTLAADADISLLIRSIGATGVEGTVGEFRRYLSMLEAWRYRHEVSSCDERGVTDDAILVRCDFSFDFLGSDRLGLGPYDGGAFDITVRDGRVLQVLKVWAFDRFSREMWEPFAEWVTEAHPRDAGRMYSDPARRGVRLDEGSIRRWERHTATYIRIRLAEARAAES